MYEQDFLTITRTAIDNVFKTEFSLEDNMSGWPLLHATNEEIFKRINITNGALIIEMFKGVNIFETTAEGENYKADSGDVKNRKTIVPKKKTKKLELSQELFDDQMHGVWNDLVQDMARKIKVSRDIEATELFRAAFTTELTADGLPLISASHVTISGLVYSNNVNAALAPASLNTGIIMLQTQVDEAGVIMGNQPAYLIVSPENYSNAITVTQSALASGGGNNDLNVFRSNYGIKVYPSPYLSAAFTATQEYTAGNSLAWFLLARTHGLRRVVRQDVQTNFIPHTTNTVGMNYYTCTYREVYSALNPSGVVGSAV